MSETTQNENWTLIAKRTTYFMTGLNTASGVTNLVLGVYKSDSLLLVGGVISILGGAILLTGIIKDSARYVFVYLILQTVVFALGTIFGLLLMLVMVTVTSQWLDKRDVRVGNLFVVDSDLIPLVVIVVLVLIIIAWIVHFLIYVFYDEMLSRNKEAARSRAQSAGAAYEAAAEEGDSASGVVFIHNNINN